MSGINGIHHICIHARDIEASIAFYRDLMGFRLIGRETNATEEYAMLKLNDSRLELIQPHVPTEDDFGNRGSITHIGLGVEGSIDDFVAWLRGKGVKFLTEEIEDHDAPMGGLRAIQLLGPSEEHINLYQWKREF